MKNISILFILFLGSMLFIGACAKKVNPSVHSHGDTSHNHSSISLKDIQGNWSLVEMDNQNVAKHKATLEISKSTIKAYSGCNTFHNIVYSLRDGDNNVSLNVADMQSTTIGCKSGNIETVFIKNLKNTYNIKVPQGVLILSTNTGLELMFIRSRMRK